MEDIRFIPGVPPQRHFPLSRFIPTIPSGIVEKWLGNHLPAGSTVLDPFGTAPQISLEAARAGYRVMVVSNNPIVSFLVQFLASSPSREEVRSVVEILGSSRKGKDRLEVYIQSLYETVCPVCGSVIQVERYIWDRAMQQPILKIINCPYCHANGEKSITPDDLERLAPVSQNPLQRAMALERIAGMEEEFRQDAQEVINCYPPRALYSLFTLINRLESLELSFRQREILTAILILCCDQANALWPYPTLRAHPRQLTIPPRYYEYNLWKVVEKAEEELCGEEEALPFAWYPDPPPAGKGIYLFRGRIRDAVDLQRNAAIRGAITVFPRPSQAFWTLSAAWAGWLWGKESVNPLKHALSRRRYDWNWHTTALNMTLKGFSPVMEQVPILGLIPEAESSFLLAVLSAAGSAGLKVAGVSYREADELAEIELASRDDSELELEIEPDLKGILQTAVLKFLKELGEPADYLQLSTVGCAALAQRHCLPTEQPLSQINLALRQLLHEPAHFIHYGEGEANSEAGKWWLRNPDSALESLADRLEGDIYQQLVDFPGILQEALEETLYLHFRGMLTPPADLINHILESYSGAQPTGNHQLFLKPQDQPQNRAEDLARLKKSLISLGTRLNYQVQEGDLIRWQDPGQSSGTLFAIQVQSTFSRLVRSVENSTWKRIIVIPGSRANLAAYKIHRDPALADAIQHNWQLVKYRHILQLSENPLLTREMWEKQIDADPPEYRVLQMDMF